VRGCQLAVISASYVGAPSHFTGRSCGCRASSRPMNFLSWLVIALRGDVSRLTRNRHRPLHRQIGLCSVVVTRIAGVVPCWALLADGAGFEHVLPAYWLLRRRHDPACGPESERLRRSISTVAWFRGATKFLRDELRWTGHDARHNSLIASLPPTVQRVAAILAMRGVGSRLFPCAPLHLVVSRTVSRGIARVCNTRRRGRQKREKEEG